MAKAKKQFGLKGGHPTAFRRTVDVGTEKNPNRVQLVFQPGEPLELTERELEGLKDELAEGFIVPWEEHGQGMRPVASPTADQAKADALQGQIDELTAQNAELTQQLADVKVTPKAAELKALKDQVAQLTTANAELTKQLEDATAPAANDAPENDADDDEGDVDANAPLGDEAETK